MKDDKVFFWLLDSQKTRVAPMATTEAIGYPVETSEVSSPDEVVDHLASDVFDVLCVEDVFPFQRTKLILKLSESLPGGRPMVVTVAHAINVPTAVSLMEQGVFTVISGDPRVEQIASAIARASKVRRDAQKIFDMSASLARKSDELTEEKVKLRKKMSEVTLMRLVAEWLGKARSLEEGLSAVLPEIGSFLGAERGIFIASPAPDRWVERDNGVPEIHRRLLPREANAFRRSTRFRLDYDSMRISEPTDDKPVNAVAFPIKMKKRYLGYGLFFGDLLPEISQDALRLLEAIGVQVGAFVENVVLNEQVEIEKDRLFRIKEENHFLYLLASSHHGDTRVDAVFELICQEIGRFVPFAGIEMFSLVGTPILRSFGHSSFRRAPDDGGPGAYAAAWSVRMEEAFGKKIDPREIDVREAKVKARGSLVLPDPRDTIVRWEEPLKFGDDLLGVLVIHRPEAPMSTPSSDRVLGATVSHLGIFLHTMREREIVLDMATHDAMTGLHNYRSFQTILGREFESNQRYGTALSLMMIDLDNFKPVNDTFGHQVGDMVLRGVADIIQRNLRKTDYGFRYGGDEFVILMPFHDAEQAGVLANRVREDVHKELSRVPPYEFNLSVSIGIADDRSIRTAASEELLQKADGALYMAKNGGRDRICFAEIVNEKASAEEG